MLKPSVQVDTVNGILVAEFWDCLRLDTGAVQDLRTKYESHLQGRGRPEVVVDLIGVGFAGSTSLGHFVMLHRLARSKGGQLIFCNVDPNVYEVFQVSKLATLFAFLADRPAALALAEEPPGVAGLNGNGKRNGGVTNPSPSPSPSPSEKSGGNALIRGLRRRKLSE